MQIPQQTDADGDDEDDHASSDHQITPQNGLPSDKENKRPQTGYASSDEEFFGTSMTAIAKTPARTPAIVASPAQSIIHDHLQMSPSAKHSRWKPGHARNMSTSTVLFSPTKDTMDPSRPTSPEKRSKTGTRSGTATGTTTPGRLDALNAGGVRTPKRIPAPLAAATRPRPILPPRDSVRQVPNMATFLAINQRGREPSFNAVALDLASDLGDNNHNPNFGNLDALALPASFTTQFEMAARMKKAREEQNGSQADSDSNRMSRIMLARMTTLEEGFRDMLQEVKGLKQGDSQIGSRGAQTPPIESSKRKGKAKKRNSKRDDAEERLGSSL